MEYQNGKIYKIRDLANTKCYYGSTVKELKERLWKHKTSYQTRYYSVHDLFDEFGLDNCIIELVEEYPCESKQQLEQREGWYIKNNDCVNQRVQGLTYDEVLQNNKDWYTANRETHLERTSQYQKEHPDIARKASRAFYQRNKEYYSEWQKANRDRINERRRANRALKKKSITQ